jgi:hypothetical protein
MRIGFTLHPGHAVWRGLYLGRPALPCLEGVNFRTFDN